MKTIVVILLAGVLCGCQKKEAVSIPSAPSAPAADPAIAAVPQTHRWEYKVVTLKNYAHQYEEDADAVATTNQVKGIMLSRMWLGESGGFDWEHGAFDSFDNRVSIADLGNDGWDLVSAVPALETIPDVDSDHLQSGTMDYVKFNNTRTAEIILIFKREK